MGYLVYEVKYTNKKVGDNDVAHLLTQLDRCNINYYNIGFFSRSDFNITDEKSYYLRTLKNLYEF